MRNIDIINHENVSKTSINSSYLQALLATASDLEPLLVSADSSRDARQLAVQILSGNANNTALYHGSLVCDQHADVISNTQLRMAYLHVLLLPIQAWRNVLLLATQDIQQQWQAMLYCDLSTDIIAKNTFRIFR